jgi:hypothetical protein
MLAQQPYSKPHLLKVITAIAELRGRAWPTAYFHELVLDSPVMWSGHTVVGMFQTMPPGYDTPVPMSVDQSRCIINGIYYFSSIIYHRSVPSLSLLSYKHRLILGASFRRPDRYHVLGRGFLRAWGVGGQTPNPRNSLVRPILRSKLSVQPLGIVCVHWKGTSDFLTYI